MRVAIPESLMELMKRGRPAPRIAGILGVNLPTLRNWSSGVSSPSESENLRLLVVTRTICALEPFDETRGSSARRGTMLLLQLGQTPHSALASWFHRPLTIASRPRAPRPPGTPSGNLEFVLNPLSPVVR